MGAGLTPGCFTVVQRPAYDQRKQQRMMVWVLRPCAPAGNPERKLPAPGLRSAQLWPLEPSGSERADGRPLLQPLLLSLCKICLLDKNKIWKRSLLISMVIIYRFWHSWVPLPELNHGLKLLGKKCMCTQPCAARVLVLLLFPKQYGETALHMVFTLC